VDAEDATALHHLAVTRKQQPGMDGDRDCCHNSSGSVGDASALALARFGTPESGPRRESIGLVDPRRRRGSSRSIRIWIHLRVAAGLFPGISRQLQRVVSGRPSPGSHARRDAYAEPDELARASSITGGVSPHHCFDSAASVSWAGECRVAGASSHRIPIPRASQPALAANRMQANAKSNFHRPCYMTWDAEATFTSALNYPTTGQCRR
jgi:hypothetical protein